MWLDIPSQIEIAELGASKQPVRFTSKRAAEAFFATPVEQCDCCGMWTASAADHTQGAIVGPCVEDNGEVIYDRICRPCDDLTPEQRREMQP